MRVFTAVLFFAWCSFAMAGKDTFGDVVVSRVTTIYDGDSFSATIDSWPEIAGKNIPIRIYGIDTPEMRGECKREIELARMAKKATVALIRSAKVIELKQMRRDKYFRIDADVYADGKNVGDKLIKDGLAKPYYGGKKNTWCN